MQKNTKQQVEQLTEQYYHEILRYCKSHFPGDIYAAEECTQEVFLLLLEKKDELDLSDNLRGWLHAAAERIILNYKRKTATRLSVEGEDLEKAESIPVELPDEMQSDAFAELSAEEYSLLIRYYETNDRTWLAAKLGISMNTLYQRIHTIKNKLKRNKNSP